MDNSKKENQIGCGYCIREFRCTKRDPKVNKAKLGCKGFKHWQDELEIWKDIPGYEGLYQVSSFGRVKSLARITLYNNKYTTVRERILKNGINSRRYFGVVLYKQGIKKSINVHQLVAMAFFDHKQSGYKWVINHKDFNPLNNRVENLEIVTQRENANQKHIESTSKFIGVSWYKSRNKWESYISINGCKKRLGYYRNEHIAHIRYQLELSKLK